MPTADTKQKLQAIKATLQSSLDAINDIIETLSGIKESDDYTDLEDSARDVYSALEGIENVIG